jgi:hypothetical protein
VVARRARLCLPLSLILATTIAIIFKQPIFIPRPGSQIQSQTQKEVIATAGVFSMSAATMSNNRRLIESLALVPTKCCL